MKRILIVNADDCNLTPGVTKAILECHDRGIVSSTTWMVNLETNQAMVREVKQRKNLGLGIHLNVTLGKPLSPWRKVKSLVDPQGYFKKLPKQMKHLPKEGDIVREYEQQIQIFQKLFGRRPTHLDTHHQVHDHPLFFRALIHVAARFHLPVRRSRLMLAQNLSLRGAERRSNLKSKIASPSAGLAMTTLQTTDFFFGNFTPSGYWQYEPLETLLQHLPEGVSEIMCHPGYHDKNLRAISSFTAGRQEELKLLRSSYLRSILKQNAATLSHFGLCYT